MPKHTNRTCALNPPRYTTEKQKQEPLGQDVVDKSTMPTLTLPPSPQDAPRVGPNGSFFSWFVMGRRWWADPGLAGGRPSPSNSNLMSRGPVRPDLSNLNLVGPAPAQPITLSKTHCPARPGRPFFLSSLGPARPITWQRGP